MIIITDIIIFARQIIIVLLFFLLLTFLQTPQVGSSETLNFCHDLDLSSPWGEESADFYSIRTTLVGLFETENCYHYLDLSSRWVRNFQIVCIQLLKENVREKRGGGTIKNDIEGEKGQYLWQARSLVDKQKYKAPNPEGQPSTIPVIQDGEILETGVDIKTLDLNPRQYIKVIFF